MNRHIKLIAEYTRQRQFIASLALRSDAQMSAIARDHLLRTPEVSEGVLLAAGTFPAAALVWNHETFASGVYVGGRVVLTAAHVARIEPKHVTLPAATLADRNAATDARVIASVLPNVSIQEWDAALLVIDRRPDVVPGRIATPAEFVAAQDQQRGLTVCGFGWGWPQGRPDERANGVKRSIEIPIAKMAAPVDLPENFFVAGDATKTSHFHAICKMDSGAPAFSVAEEQMIVFGVASATLEFTAAFEEGCGTSPFGIFSRVDLRRDWILDQISRFSD